jgi:hypothetical protein
VLKLQQLAIQTEIYEREHRDSLLLVKYYDLLDRQEDACRLAQQLRARELRNLAVLISRGATLSDRAEQFLRVIYVHSISRANMLAIQYFQQFVGLVRDHLPISSATAFRLVIGQMLTGDRSDLLGLVSTDRLALLLHSAWAKQDQGLLQEAHKMLLRIVEQAQELTPLNECSDVWYYIVLIRIERLVKKLGFGHGT